MQFKNPIVAIQQCQEQDDMKVHTKTFVSFQSILGTNIIGVNNLLLVKLYITHKERGRKNMAQSVFMESSRMRHMRPISTTTMAWTLLTI